MGVAGLGSRELSVGKEPREERRSRPKRMNRGASHAAARPCIPRGGDADSA